MPAIPRDSPTPPCPSSAPADPAARHAPVCPRGSTPVARMKSLTFVPLFHILPELIRAGEVDPRGGGGSAVLQILCGTEPFCFNLLERGTDHLERTGQFGRGSVVAADTLEPLVQLGFLALQRLQPAFETLQILAQQALLGGILYRVAVGRRCVGVHGRSLG